MPSPPKTQAQVHCLSVFLSFHLSLPLPEDRELWQSEPSSRPPDCFKLWWTQYLPSCPIEMRCDTKSRLLWGTWTCPLNPIIKIHPALTIAESWVHSLSVFLSQVSVHRESSDWVSLCLKTEVLTIVSHHQSQTANFLTPMRFETQYLPKSSPKTGCDTRPGFKIGLSECM